MKNVNMTYLNKKIMNFNFCKSIILEKIKENSLSNYARNIEKIIISSDEMYYDPADRIIAISMKNSKNKIKDVYNQIIEEFGTKYKIFEKEFINIMLLFSMYHEIEHARQEKSFNESELNNVNKLDKFANILRTYNHDEYNFSHGRYYHEYSASINAGINLLKDLENKYKNRFFKETIEMFNNYLSYKILMGYTDRENKMEERHTPISNLYDITMKVTSKDKEKYINMLTEDGVYAVIDHENNNLSNDIEDVVHGRIFPIEIMNKLYELSFGLDKTTNIFDTLSEVYVDINENKKI